MELTGDNILDPFTKDVFGTTVQFDRKGNALVQDGDKWHALVWYMRQGFCPFCGAQLKRVGLMFNAVDDHGDSEQVNLGSMPGLPCDCEAWLQVRRILGGRLEEIYEYRREKHREYLRAMAEKAKEQLDEAKRKTRGEHALSER